MPPPTWKLARSPSTRMVRIAMLKPLDPPRLKIADRAGVEAAAVGLELVDDLHGADLGRAGDRAAGKEGPDHVDRAGAWSQPPLDRGDQVMHLGE